MRNLLLALAVLFGTCSVFAEQEKSLTEIADGVYATLDFGSNTTVLINEEGVLVVDAGGLKKDGEGIIELIRQKTDAPIKYLVITHYHFDHVMGICAFPEETTVIGHKNMAKNLEAYGQEFFDNFVIAGLQSQVAALTAQRDSLKTAGDASWNDVEQQLKDQELQLEYTLASSIVLPDETFEGDRQIVMGSDTVNLIYPEHTHTDGNIMVEFKNQNVLATGDFFFNNSFPYIDFAANCDTKNWSEQAKVYAAKGYKTIVPGHGQLATSEDLLGQAHYLADLRKKVQADIDAGKTLAEVQASETMEKYADYGLPFLRPMAIEAVYKELTERE